MKGIETIVKRIQDDAGISAEEIAAAAKAQADEIVAAANEKAKQIYAQGIREAETEVDNVKLRSKSITDLEGRKALLTARQSVVEEAFAQADAKLTALRGDAAAYAKILIDLAKPALAEGSRVQVSQRDIDAVGELVKNDLGVEVDGASFDDGGIVVVTGGVELNLTFMALLRQHREELEQAVASVLFR